MRVSGVNIHHFRNFENVQVETGQNLILVGANATGKTNFIHALRLVLDPSLSRRDRLLTGDDFWRGEGLEPWYGRQIKVSVDLTDYVEDINLNALLQSYCPPGRPGAARLTYVYKPKANVLPEEAGEEAYEYRTYGGDDPNLEVQSDMRENFGLKVIDALRDAESDLIARGSPLRRLFNLYGITPDALGNVVDHIQRANDVLRDIDQIKGLEGAIRDRLFDMTEHIHDLDPVLRLLASDAESLVRALRLLIEGGRPISDTSLGLANVLFLTLCVLEVERREAITSPIRGDEYHFTILAIEEPEAHLHPHLQRLLFRDFLKRAPLILSTHSPHIASVAQVDSIVMFRKPDLTRGSEVYSTAKLKDLLTPSQLKDLERYLDVTRAEILFSRGVILVEGDAEEFLVPALARLAGYDLDRYGITVCNIRGTDFTPYIRLVGSEGLQIPFVVLTDGDKYAKLTSEALTEAKSNGTITQDEIDELKKLSPAQQRISIEERGIAYHFGLKRCIDLLDLIEMDAVLRGEIQQAYDDMKWSEVRKKLKQAGIFVNDWTLEPALVEIGYAEDSVDVLEQVGTGPEVMSKLRDYLTGDSFTEDQIRYLIGKISESGKGRVGQRLSAELYKQEPHSRPIPAYIQASLDYLTSKLGCRETESEDLEAIPIADVEDTVSDFPSVMDEDDTEWDRIPF